MIAKRSYKTIALVLVAVLITASQAPGSNGDKSVTDSEQIIDVEKLKASLNEATSPISNRIKQSKLTEKFDTVNIILQQKDIDKEALLQALEGLRNEMNSFTQSWSELTEPLWKGQEAISQTINKVRVMLARTRTGEPSAKVKPLLQNYDKRLSNLASAIKKEKNVERKKRLKLVFANVLSLRQLTERAGMIDLGPAQQAVYIKIIESLSNLEVALTNSTFQVERTRIVLAGQAEFIGNYADILRGLIESEKLAKVLSEMNSVGAGLGGLAGDIGGLNGRIQEFTDHMNALAERLSVSIDAQTTPIIEAIDFDEEDIDKKIEEYSSKQTNSVQSKQDK